MLVLFDVLKLFLLSEELSFSWYCKQQDPQRMAETMCIDKQPKEEEGRRKGDNHNSF